ncbi:MAG: sigma factor-like helix-turn-helix DNA-binding protein, partial [Pseudomonadota bacterium]
EMMEGRLDGSDFSLNAQQAGDDGREWVETLEDDGPDSEARVARNRDLRTARNWIAEAMGSLTDREKMIIVARKIEDQPETLESLGGKLGLSKERVRQLEAQALRKMRKHLEENVGAEAGSLAAEF